MCCVCVCLVCAKLALCTKLACLCASQSVAHTVQEIGESELFVSGVYNVSWLSPDTERSDLSTMEVTLTHISLALYINRLASSPC